jgi:hypothetical protein
MHPALIAIGSNIIQSILKPKLKALVDGKKSSGVAVGGAAASVVIADNATTALSNPALIDTTSLLTGDPKIDLAISIVGGIASLVALIYRENH